MGDEGEHILEAGWMVDGTGGPVRQSVRLTVSGGYITRIDEGRSAERTGAARWRFPSDTVLPGLIDAHFHLCMSAVADADVRRRQLVETYDAAVAGMQRRIDRMLARGIVAGRDAGDAGGYALRYRREHLADDGVGFRLRAAGPGWHAAGRYGRFVGRAPGHGESLAEAVRRIGRPGDHLKIVNSGLNSLTEFGRQGPPQFSRGDLTAAVAAAAERDLYTMVHANGARPVTDAVAAGARSIEHGYFMGNDALGRLADAGTYWVPTVTPMAVHARSAREAEGDIAARTVAHQLAQVAASRNAGVRLVVGTDAGGIGVVHGEAVLEEMDLLLQAGIPLPAVMRAASGEAAALLKMESMGELVTGKRACLVVAPGPPEALPGSLSRIKLLMIDGRPVVTSRNDVPGAGGGETRL